MNELEFSLIFGESAFYGFMIVSSVRILYPSSLSLVCRVPAWEGMGLGSDEVSITRSSAILWLTDLHIIILSLLTTGLCLHELLSHSKFRSSLTQVEQTWTQTS